MNNPQQTAETPEQLIEHISRLMAEAEAMLAGPVSGEMKSDQMSGKLNDLKSRMSTARDRVGSMYTSARRGVLAGAKYTDDTIRQYPYYSIAIAVGVGILVGSLLRRGDQE